MIIYVPLGLQRLADLLMPFGTAICHGAPLLAHVRFSFRRQKRCRIANIASHRVANALAT